LKRKALGKHQPRRPSRSCLFRIDQEALQNAVKHGAAHNVSVELAAKESVMSLFIGDDGIGFVSARRRNA